MRICLVLISVFFAVSVIDAQAGGLKNATVRFRILDDIGRPVENANVDAFSLSDSKGYQGLTDTKGMFSCYAKNIYSQMSGHFTKEGYYRTLGALWVATKWGDVPTNTLSLVLKRIINPVPMLKRKVAILFPVLDQPLGFDFEVGDLIEPYGDGKTADIWITGTRKLDIPDVLDLRAILVTSNELNGFIEFPVVREMDQIDSKSDLEPPQRAPDVGYTNQIAPYLLFVPSKQYNASYQEKKDFLFRVRSQTNELGEVTHANVGWFYESIKLTGYKDLSEETGRLKCSKTESMEEKRKKMRITFAYYYNPDPLSRSLEPSEITGRQGVFLPKPKTRAKSNR